MNDNHRPGEWELVALATLSILNRGADAYDRWIDERSTTQRDRMPLKGMREHLDGTISRDGCNDE